MPLWAGFIGPAYTARSQNLDAEALINAFVETIGSSGNAKRAMLLGTPGLKFLLNVAELGCRGCWQQDGLTLAVVGQKLYQIDVPNMLATELGTIVNDGKPVSFASNGQGGNQVVVCGGGFLYVLTLPTLVLSAAIALPLTNAPVMVEFWDGYFHLLEADTIRVWFSALEDGTSWSALDFYARSQVSDNLVGIKRLRDKMWLYGSLTTEVFYDTGDTDNPFQPYPGSIMQEGLMTPWALGIQGEYLVWLSQDSEGSRRIVRASDFAPERISTPAIDYALAQYQTVDDAEILVYEQEGHPFATFSCPTGRASWSYDARESAVRQEPTWHQRCAWDASLNQFNVWEARGVCQTNGVIMAGDRATGDLYTLDLDTYADYHGAINRVRQAPYISDDNQWIFIDQIELGVQAGVGLLPTTQGDDPQVMLEITRDSNHTWDPPTFAYLGGLSDFDAETKWFQLGRVRSDRLGVRISMTDPVKMAWGPGLYLRATPGSGQL